MFVSPFAGSPNDTSINALLMTVTGMARGALSLFSYNCSINKEQKMKLFSLSLNDTKTLILENSGGEGEDVSSRFFFSALNMTCIVLL